MSQLGLGLGLGLRAGGIVAPPTPPFYDDFDRMGDGNALATSYNGLTYSNLVCNLSSFKTFDNLRVEATVTNWTAFLGNVGLCNVGWKGLVDRAFGMYTTSSGTSTFSYRINFTTPAASTAVVIAVDVYAAFVRERYVVDPRWERVALTLKTAAGASVGAVVGTQLTNALIDDITYFKSRVYLPAQLPLGSTLRQRRTLSRAVTGGDAYYLQVDINASAAGLVGIPAGFGSADCKNIIGALNNLTIDFT